MSNWPLALDAQIDTHKFYASDPGTIAACGFLVSQFSASIAEKDPENAMWVAKGTHEYMLESLHKGDTIYITSDMMRILERATQDYDGPLWVEPETLLTDNGWMLLEDPIIGEDIRGKPALLYAMSWTRDQKRPNVLHTFFYTDTSDPRDTVMKDIVQDGRLRDILSRDLGPPPWSRWELIHYLPVAWPDPEYPDTDPFVFTGNEKIFMEEPGTFFTKMVMKFFVTFNILAQQTITQVAKEVPPRSVRKRAGRWNPVEGQRYITLITLRKKKVQHNEEPQDVPWTHRWIVTGFWRRQWYPSLQRHKWVYIHEYVKGPEHLPLVIRERRVFNLAR